MKLENFDADYDLIAALKCLISLNAVYFQRYAEVKHKLIHVFS